MKDKLTDILEELVTRKCICACQNDGTFPNPKTSELISHARKLIVEEFLRKCKECKGKVNV